MNIIQQLEAEQVAAIAAKRTFPAFEPGDTVRVMVRVTEGARTRIALPRRSGQLARLTRRKPCQGSVPVE